MANETTILKIAEVRQLLKEHTRTDLELITESLYKMLSKNQKLENNVAALMQNPSKDVVKANKKNESRSFEEVKTEANWLIENAYSMNFLIPNQIVSKKDRPKWRFVAKKLYKELLILSQQSNTSKEAVHLLQKIYEMLCYSCNYSLFRSYDSFDSVGISQVSFFETIISAAQLHLDNEVFIDRSVDLIVKNPLNRHTLKTELMDVLLQYITSADLKYLLIEKCKSKRAEAETMNKTKKSFWDYEHHELLNHYTTLILKTYLTLYEANKGIVYFFENIQERDLEIKYYILSRHLFDHNEKDLIVQQLEDAIAKKVPLRKTLTDLLNFIKTNNSLPAYL